MGDIVNHISFGKGKTVEEGEGFIKVAFDNKDVGEKLFVFPDAFSGFLTYDDKELQKSVNKKLAALRRKIAAERKKLEKKKEEAILTGKIHTAMQMTAAQKRAREKVTE